MSRFSRFNIEPDEVFLEAETSADQVPYLNTLIDTIEGALRDSFHERDDVINNIRRQALVEKQADANTATQKKYTQPLVQLKEARQAIGNNPVYYSISQSQNNPAEYQLTRLPSGQKSMFVMYSNPTPDLITIIPSLGQKQMSVDETGKYFKFEGKAGTVSAFRPVPFVKTGAQDTYTMPVKGTVVVTPRAAKPQQPPQPGNAQS